MAVAWAILADEGHTDVTATTTSDKDATSATSWQHNKAFHGSNLRIV